MFLGSTWLSSIIDLIHHPDEMDQRNDTKLDERVRHLDVSLPFRNPKISEMEYILQSASPRRMLTHLPYAVLEKQVNQDKAKVVVVVRNPKDTLVSYFHFYRSVRNIDFPNSWDAFFEQIKGKKLIGGDFFEYYQGWWAQKDKANLHFVSYEDLKANPMEGVRKIAAFLGKPLHDDVIKRIVQHTTFDKMKDNAAVNHKDNRAFNQNVSKFMRKGEVGDWVNHFTPEQNQYIEERIREMGDGDSGLKFQYSM